MAIDALTEEVATNLEEVAQATRSIDTKALGFLLGGLAVGVGIGFYFGYKYNREKIKAEIYKETEEEITKIRELYQQKTVAATPKPSVEEVIEERGYSTHVDQHERPLKPPVPVYEAPALIDIPVLPDNADGEIWDYAEELKNRTIEEPYVIHREEFENNDSKYAHVTYTYYAGDDILVGEDEIPIPHADLVVGQSNLKFGHGTDDIHVVFVRNDKLELEMEICRVPTSYEEEVLGLGHDESN